MLEYTRLTERQVLGVLGKTDLQKKVTRLRINFTLFLPHSILFHIAIGFSDYFMENLRICTY